MLPTSLNFHNYLVFILRQSRLTPNQESQMDLTELSCFQAARTPQECLITAVAAAYPGAHRKSNDWALVALQLFLAELCLEHSQAESSVSSIVSASMTSGIQRS